MSGSELFTSKHLQILSGTPGTIPCLNASLAMCGAGCSPKSVPFALWSIAVLHHHHLRLIHHPNQYLPVATVTVLSSAEPF